MTKRNVDPQSEALGFRLGMTKDGSFPYLPFVIPVKTGIQIQLDPQSEALGFRLRMTGGAGSRIKCGMTKRNVDPQSEALRFRLRTARGWNNILCKWRYLVIFVGYGISTQLAIIINQNAQKQIWN